MKNKIFIIVIALFAFRLSAQTGDLGELKQIYEGVEYNTLAFNDLKQQWILDDPTLIRELYNRFIVRNSFRLNGRPVKLDVVKEKTALIQEGDVVIQLRKRYYDDEIEYFAFMPQEEFGKDNPQLLFDPVVDGFFLKEIVGQKYYEKIQELSYFSKDITKSTFGTKYGYYFDLNLNLLNSEVMFWNTTSNNRNKYLLSLFSQWGNDYVNLPGWYSREMIVGSRLTYFKSLTNNPDDFTYKISVGAGTPAFGLYKDDTKVKPLWVAGQSVYGKIEGYMLGFIESDFFKNILVSLDAKVTIVDNKFADFGKYTTNVDFFSNKNTFTFMLKKKDIVNVFDFGMLDIGLAIGSHDIHKLQLDQATRTVIDLEKGKKDFIQKFNNFVTLEVGLRNSGGLIQHNINLLAGYSSDGYGFMGLKAMAMLSGTFGLDVRVYSAMSVNKTKYPYKYDSYIVFSPIIRINY